MTPEDDAFIRKIVDSPGDDLPRLVYADWLDERDDPRGAYLRAELEWAKPWRDGNRPGDASAVWALGVGLDEVWVARVSRPPVGVCCEQVNFIAVGSSLTESNWAFIKGTLKAKLTPSHEAFLRNRNGAIPHPDELIYFRSAKAKRREELYIHRIFRPLDRPRSDLAYSHAHAEEYMPNVEANDVHLHFAQSGDLGFLAISFNATQYGGVYYFNRPTVVSSSRPRKIAASLPEFFSNLYVISR